MIKNLLPLLSCLLVSTITFGQHVGINTNAPGFPLDVNGDLNLRSGLRLSGLRGDSGAVLMSRGNSLAPVWNKWQGFRAIASGNQTISSSSIESYVLLNFDNAVSGSRFNIGGAFSPSAKLFTVPENGVYIIMASAGINSAPAGTYRISVRRTGSLGAFASTTSHIVGDLAGLSHIISTVTTSFLESGTELGAYLSDTNPENIVVNNGAATFFSIIKIH